MHIVKCGNKYINMDQVTYIEHMDALAVFAIHFAVVDMTAAISPDKDIVIFLEEQEEIEALEHWLNCNQDRP